VEIRALSWLQVAERLGAGPRTAGAVERIRSHPTLAARA
jgi:hypothetical protein